MPKKNSSSIAALCSYIKLSCKKSRCKHPNPLRSFRHYCMRLPELQSEESAQAAIAGVDYGETVIKHLTPGERAYISKNSGNATHMAYFYFMVMARQELAAWLIRNELKL